MENLTTSEVISLHKECKERIEAANKELAGCKAVLKLLNAEIDTRKSEYEMGRDL